MKHYSTGEMCKLLNVTSKTLYNWDKSGKLKAFRTPTNRRFYTEEQYFQYTGQSVAKEHRLNVAYARVSSRSQKDDLPNQINFIQNYVNAKGVILDETFTDIGSGLNYNRKNWNKLLDLVTESKIDTVYITYKDRFIRFGYDWFERFLNKHGTKLVVLNKKDTSPNQEFVEDIISIIHVFSCRLYGLRKYKQTLKDDKSLKRGE